MPDKKAAGDAGVKEALEQFEESQTTSDDNRVNYLEDTRFARMAEQWPDKIKKLREQEGRPALTINKMPGLIRSVVNESRQNKPSIKVSPVDNGADEEHAEVIAGLVRSIERNGAGADVAYDTAIDHSVTGGFGFFRIGLDYVHDESFNLEAFIDRIPNALMVHWDTSSTKFDASDWNYAFISEMLGKKEYKARYPKGSMTPFDSMSSGEGQWSNTRDEIRIAEYFKRTEKTRKIIQLEAMNPQTGAPELQVVREDDLPVMAKRLLEAGGIEAEGIKDDELARAFFELSGATAKRERDVNYHEVKRCIMNGVEVLEEDDWPGSTIPICPVWGDEVFIDGKRQFRSMIRDAKDPQMMLNFWRSATTELVALAPKAPWVGPKGFAAGNEEKWASANTRSHAYLEYDHSTGNAPTRVPFAGVPAGALQEAMNASDDMKAVTGIFDSSIGAQSNETSGKAILARERQGDVANFHFIDNLSRAIKYAGQVLVEIIPSVYSTQETIRILGEDEKANIIKLTQDAGGGRIGKDGKPELYNLSIGKYDVTVSSGPSFATQREETRETLIEIMRQVPDAAAFVGDVLLDHMDFVGADKVAKRLKHLLPPEIKQAEEAEEGGDNPEAAAAKQELEAYKKQVEEAQQAVMQEIEVIKRENEELKRNHEAEQQKLAQEYEIKSRELALKEAEAAKPPADETIQLEYDRMMALDKMQFDAEQNQLDRQTDLAKAIISKAEPDDAPETMQLAADEAMTQAGEIILSQEADL